MESPTRTTLNSFHVLVVQVLAKLMALAATVLAARLVGVAEYGLYTYALSLMAIAGMVSDLGLSPFIVREMAANPTAAPSLFGSVLSLRMLAGALLVLITGVTAYAWPGNDRLALLLVVVGLYTALSQVADTFARAFAAFEAWAPFNRVALLGQVLGLLLSVLLLIVWRRVVALPLGLSLGFIAAVAASWYDVRRRWFPVRISLGLDAWRLILKAAFPFTVGAIVGLLNQRVDALLLFHAAGGAALGVYGAAYSLLFSLSIVPAACASVLFPKLAAHAGGGWDERISGHVRLFVKLLAALSLPAAAGVTMLAGALAPVLFGPGFAGMAPVLAALSWWVPAMFVQTLLAATYGASGRQRLVVAVTVATIMGAVVVGYPLQVRFGAVGAAVARTLVESAGAVVLMVRLPHRSAALPGVGELGKILCATSGMAAVLWVLGDWPVLPVIGVGVLVYGVLLVVLGCFNADEIPLLARLQRRSSRSGGDQVNARAS